MAIDDRLYDLQEADDHRFLVYGSYNSYIAPYSSDTHGGELITEFNQRAALNTLLKRKVDLTEYAETVGGTINEHFGKAVEIDEFTGETEMQGPGLNSFLLSTLHDKHNWDITAYATGVRDGAEETPSGTTDKGDFALAIANNTRLTISAGVALVYGYYIDVDSEISIDCNDAINLEEVSEVKNNEGQVPGKECRSKFIKLAVQYTTNENARHDERLIPPWNPTQQPPQSQNIYQCVAIVINDELPYGNELLLGTITRSATGVYVVTENPAKTRMIPLDSIQGAEDYAELLKALPDDHTYGVKFGSTDGSEEGEVTNLRDIDPWLWLANESHLGRLLKSISTQADTAGLADDQPTRGVIVSDETPYTGNDAVVDEFNCLQKIDARTYSEFARMSWHQAQTPPKTGDASIDHRALYFPYSLAERANSEAPQIVSHTLRTPISDQGRQVDDTVQKPIYDTNIYECLNGLNGTDGIMTYQQAAMLEMVFLDYVNRREVASYTHQIPIGKMYGPFLSLEDAKNWFKQYTPEVHPGDYFWVINDVMEAGGVAATTAENPTEYQLHNIVTNYGTVSGTASGTVKQSSITVDVTGTGTGTAHKVDDPTGEEYEFDDIDVHGTAQGTIQATVKGTITGTLTSFSQNVSGRYICRYREEIVDEHVEAWWKFAHGIMYREGETAQGINAYEILDGDGQYQSFQDVTDSRQSVLFALEAVERGFAIPATSTMYGLVKAGPGSNLYDVIVDPTTQQLRITDALMDFVKNGGYRLWDNAVAEYPVYPGEDLTRYQYSRFPNGVVFKMMGDSTSWRSALETSGTLSHIRGPVTLDFSGVEEKGKRSDGLLLYLEDIDYLTFKGDNNPTDIPSTETLLFGVNHCKVNSPFFTNIGEWKYSEFISGGNTLQLNLPWMLVTDVFTKVKENSLWCRFASITMGDNGISSAELDMWIKYEGWEDYNGNVDRLWSSAGYIKFPPLFYEYRVNTPEEEVQVLEGETVPTNKTYASPINLSTIQHIPDNLNLKISGTAGVHQAWDENNTEYVPSGNLLVNVNWEYNGNPSVADKPEGKLYLNLYMKNSSADVLKQNFSSLRFRTPVQVIRLDNNEMSEFIPYEQLYSESPSTKL